jgi:hypothetical protein
MSGLIEDTEGASLEIRRNQAKLSGKRTLFLTPLESLAKDTDGANSGNGMNLSGSRQRTRDDSTCVLFDSPKLFYMRRSL